MIWNVFFPGERLKPPDLADINTMTTFLRDERGQDLVEYALIVAAVGLALISTISQLSNAIVIVYASITGTITGVDWKEPANGV